ncbi:MAG: NAD-dependent epimerase/dehydratase family protein [Halioglobus sp.]|nr:NAD-dependent epimerase/dehydratase family protein [Halioglobus sp.]
MWPRMHPNDGRVVSNFIVQALKGDDITLYGDGQQTRSFCYVDDLIEGFLRFMELPAGDGGAPGFAGPVNLGNPAEFTIKQLAERVIELTNSTSRIVHEPLPTDDPMQRQPNISVAREHLDDWHPEVQLLEGLRHTTAYFDALLSECA